MQANRRHATCFAIFMAALTAGCDDDEGAPPPPESRLPYAPDETVIIGAEGAEVENTPSGDACIEFTADECIQPQDECGEGAHADVLLDADGEVIEIVCLPFENETVIVDVEDGVATVPDNGAVVILDDGDLQSDVTVEGNRGVIYGDSPAEAVIDGDLNLRGNESTVRGVTVTGNVTFEGNDAELYYCVVHGDVILKGNENFVSNCTIFGSIIGSGNEDQLINNFVDGTISISGSPDECRDNQRFDDEDEDGLLDPEEIEDAEPIDCE